MSNITSRIKSAINRALGKLAFTCHDMSRLSSQALDTTLPRVTRIRMRFHLLICRWCRRYRAQLALLRKSISRLGTEAPETGPGLPSEARDRIRKKLCDHGGH